MAKFKIIRTKTFIKNYKNLSPKIQDEADFVLEKLERGERLDPKYKDHALKGDLKGLRDCHIRFDLVLIYEIDEEILILSALRIGKHNKVFK